MHMHLWDRIRAARRLKHWSQAELATALKVSPSTVGHWERSDGSAPKVERLIAVAQATGVSVEWLATGKGAMRANDARPEAIHTPALSREEARLLQYFRRADTQFRKLLLDLVERHASPAAHQSLDGNARQRDLPA